VKSILVVEDQPIMREPIAAALRREGYQTRCAGNGMEALAVARQEHPDLILLDIAMPVMDGLSCLKQLRVDPKTRGIPVIMLTAAAEREKVLTALQMGIHGYLLKSQFSLQYMLTQIRRHLDVPGPQGPEPPAGDRRPPEQPEATAAEPALARLSKGNVLAHVRQQSEFRGIPPVLQHVLALANSSRSSIDEIAEAIHHDPALTVRILRIANSSFFGAGKAATTLADAAKRIGTSGVRNAVVALSAIEHFADSRNKGLDLQQFWEHSLACATLAQLMSESLRAEVPDQVFLAGLLHDVGRIALSAAFPDHYAHAMRLAAERNVDLTPVEREIFGLTHADITHDFLNRLEVPAVVREAALHHGLGVEDIKRAARSPQSALLVAGANRLAHALVLGESGSAMLCPVQEYLTALGLRREGTLPIVKEAAARTEETKLFYASQDQNAFVESLLHRIASSAAGGVKIAMLGAARAVDPLNLFFERLGWLHPSAPALAVAHVANEGELNQCLGELKELEGRVGVELPLLVASPCASVGPSPEEAGARPCARVAVPGRYQNVLSAVVNLAGANAGTSDSGSVGPREGTQ